MNNLTLAEQKALSILTFEWRTRKELSVEWKHLKSLVIKGFAEECFKKDKEPHPFRVFGNKTGDESKSYASVKHYRRTLLCE